MSKAQVTQNQKNANSNKSQNVQSSSNRNLLLQPKRNKASTRAEPLNREQFLQRVASYNALKWHIRRKDVNPLFCARFGWKCIGRNTLQCSSCGTTLEYKTNPLWSAAVNQRVATTFLHNLRANHTPQCVWQSNPCDESFERLPLEASIMKQQLIENMRTWTQPDAQSFFVVPKIAAAAKKTLLEYLHLLPSNVEPSKHWRRHPLCQAVMMLSGSGWCLSPISAALTPYVQCRYCNKCVCLQSYEYKRVLTLLPAAEKTAVRQRTHAASFMSAIDEAEQSDFCAEEEEEEKFIDADIADAVAAAAADNDGNLGAMDITSVLNRALPLNNPDSIMCQLGRLGLKIDAQIRRTPSFQIYDTQSLQRPARFTPDAQQQPSTSSCSPMSSTLSLSPRSASLSRQHRPFGSSRVSRVFGGSQPTQGFNMHNLRWPKQSIFVKPDRNVLRSSSQSQSQSCSAHKNLKRRREEFTRNNDGEDDDEEEACVEDGTRSRKKVKISLLSELIHENDDDDDAEEDDDIGSQAKTEAICDPVRQHGRRKRKAAEADLHDDEDGVDEEWMPSNVAHKRRRCEPIQEDDGAVSSVSTTFSLPSSSTLAMNRRGRKRTYHQLKQERDAHGDGEDEQGKEEEEEDELAELQRPNKRARLQRIDTPTVHAQSCFDPIRLHHEHCPFVNSYQYDQECVPGWKYGVQLLPHNIMFLKQLMDEQCSSNSDRN